MKQKLELIKEAALDKKAVDLDIIEITEQSSFADYLVICSGASSLQRKAILQSVSTTLKTAGYKIHHQEGDTNSDWILLDCYDVIVHIFDPATRGLYNLKEIWTKTQKIR